MGVTQGAAPQRVDHVQRVRRLGTLLRLVRRPVAAAPDHRDEEAAGVDTGGQPMSRHLPHPDPQVRRLLRELAATKDPRRRDEINEQLEQIAEQKADEKAGGAR